MKTKTFIVCIILLNIVLSNYGQYIIKDEIRIPCTEVKSQQITYTCWSFSTTSFLESEIIRLRNNYIDLSEMYSVRMSYLDKAQNYVLRQGKANFGEGGLSHDVLRTVRLHGLVPQESYTGLRHGDDYLDHRELCASLNAYLDAVIKVGKPGNHWNDAFTRILDAYMGQSPLTFKYAEKNYDPLSFREAMGINAEDYINITSFTHHPFNSYFILELPDNYMNGSSFNVSLDVMMSIVDFALEKGYSLIWNGDVSDRGFSQEKGLAILPANLAKDSLFNKPDSEVMVNQNNRQKDFLNYNTTDDHAMHIVGRAKDQNDNIYYIFKDSYGEYGPYKGYLYISKAYMMMKTISITLNKEALPKEIFKKL
jgi:bleomycin hydrolase